MLTQNAFDEMVGTYHQCLNSRDIGSLKELCHLPDWLVSFNYS